MRAKAAQASPKGQGGSPGGPEARLPGESETAWRARLVRSRERAYYELRRYEIETPEQKAGFDKFAAEALIPALNRLGVKPVGVFYPEKDLSPIYVLIPHKSLESFGLLTEQLSQDQEFQKAGAAFVDAPADKPAFKNLETQVMMAFEGMPQLETPVSGEGRVFQLRTYESPSVKTGLKKIEMFNTAEIKIFRKVGLHPVFFGRTLAGNKMPNLTYMLVFKDMEEQQANWKKFGAVPDWQKAFKESHKNGVIVDQTQLKSQNLVPTDYSPIR